MTEFVAASAKVHRRTILVFGLLVGQAVVMGGCSSTLSEMPTQLGGLPAGTPERPATQSAYPAVHDMPPPRPNSVLSDAERKKAEAELTALRTRQEKQAGTAGTTASTPKDQQLRARQEKKAAKQTDKRADKQADKQAEKQAEKQAGTAGTTASIPKDQQSPQ